MTKFKEVAHYYLKAGVKCQFESGEIYTIEGIIRETVWCKELTYAADLFQCKPILKPLSDLTEPNNDGVIDIVELLKLTGWFVTAHKFEKTNVNESGLFFKTENFSGETLEFHFRYSVAHGFSLSMFEPGYYYENLLTNQLELFQNLFNNRYDVFGLIESGEAIAEEN